MQFKAVVVPFLYNSQMHSGLVKFKPARIGATVLVFFFDKLDKKKKEFACHVQQL